MTELIKEFGTHGRLIKEKDDYKIEEECYNIGIFDLEKNAEEEDTEGPRTCLYIQYCSSEYGKLKTTETVNKQYDCVLNLVKNFGHGKDWVNEFIEDITSDIILDIDGTFSDHLKQSPAANPDDLSDNQVEEAAYLWGQYLFERGP